MSRSDLIDVRSDTVTQPNAGMRAAMAQAPVGDDVYGDDPTVAALEARVADLLGKQSGLFFPSGTQSNLCAVLAHCERGEEVLTGDDYHVFKYEARGMSVLGGVTLHPLALESNGSIAPARINQAVKPDDSHFPITKLLSLENTHNGLVIDLATSMTMANAARAHGLAVHLDGARIANAAVALQTSLEGAVDFADTVSFCLSKGLGAPVGSVLVGPRDFIAKARRLRKMLGGGMRQVGVIAAACHYALDHHLPALAQDHARAQMLDQALHDTAKLTVLRQRTQTNMVYLTLPQGGFDGLRAAAAKNAINLSGGDDSVRIVLHHDLNDDDISALANTINQWAA